MEKTESLEEFYKRKFNWLPENISNELGHFNVFRLEPFVGEMAKPVRYKRRDFYKIMLIVGKSRVHFADKVIEVLKQALSFSNPQIPYKWEHPENVQYGAFCVFNHDFSHQYGNLNQYEVFQPDSTHQKINASQRISALFLKLLERQFPVDDNHQKITLRSASYEVSALGIGCMGMSLGHGKVTDTRRAVQNWLAGDLVRDCSMTFRFSA